MRATRRVRRDAKRLFRLCLSDGGVDEDRTRRVVRRIAAARYRNRAAILAQLRRLIMLEEARQTARVESAAPLAADMRNAVQARLERLYGRPLAPSFEEKPSLLGGLRIRVANDVYDRSVHAALNALQARLSNGRGASG